MATDRDRLIYVPNRREVLIKGIAGAFAVAGYLSHSGTVFASVPGVTKGETPGLEEGPFWVDGQQQRSDVRTDSSTSALQAGTPLQLAFTVSQLSDAAPYTITPLAGAKVDIWNANAQGVYSDVAAEGTTGTDYLRGYQLSSSTGAANFVTNYPGWYSGRTPHVHMRVRTYTAAGAVAYDWCSQVFFADNFTAQIYAANSAYHRTTAQDAFNTTDRVFNGSSFNSSPASEAGDYTLLTLSNGGTYVQGSFHIVLDLQDAANADPTNGAQAGSGGGPTATGTGPGGSTGAGTGGKPGSGSTGTGKPGRRR